MIVIIFTHSAAFFPNDKLISILWNWSNFAVPVFIFCSVYLFLQKYLDRSINLVIYFKKRLSRLLLPYYVFLCMFLLLLPFVSPQLLSFKYIWQSVAVIGGVDINWLVLLFIYITILSPFFVWSLKKASILFWTFFVCSFGSTVILLFYPITFPYKFVLWLPWGLMLYVTWFYIRFEHKQKLLIWMFICSLVLFIISFILLQSLSKSTILIHNKYPPNLLYLSYGITVLLGLTFISKYLFSHRFIQYWINFFSKYSYSIFFLHYFILTFFAAYIKQIHFNGISLFLSVLITTVCLQKFYIWLETKEVTKNIYRRVFSQHRQQ